MPDLKTRADSLRNYLTGAGSGGGAQTDPNASLGNHRSSTEAASYSIVIGGTPINHLTVDFAAAGNAVGNGTISLIDANNVAWNDAGGVQGTALNLPGNASTGIAEASGNPAAFLRLTRTSASALTGGPATISLAALLDNLFGMNDVASADALAGITDYRAVIVKNESAGSVTNFFRYLGTLGTEQTSDVAHLSSSGAGSVSTTGDFSDWPACGWCRVTTSGGTLREIVYYSSRTAQTLTVPAAGRGRLGSSAAAGAADDLLDAVPGVAIAIDTHGVQAANSQVEVIADAQTAPAGVTWKTGITPATGLNVGTLTAGQEVAVWIKREIPAGAHSTAAADVRLVDLFDAA